MSERLLAAARAAADKLAHCERVIDNDYGAQAATPEEWETGGEYFGPSDELKELRAAIAEAKLPQREDLVSSR